MKKYVLIIALIVGGLTACSDWLDVQPKTSIKGKDLFSSESGFKDVLTGFYLSMGSTEIYAKEMTSRQAQPVREPELNPRKKRIRVLLNGDSEAAELVYRVCETIPENAKKKGKRFLEALEKEPRFKKMAEKKKKSIVEKANGVTGIYFDRQEKLREP